MDELEKPNPGPESIRPSSEGGDPWQKLSDQAGVDVLHLGSQVSDYDDGGLPIERRIWLPLGLFIATCVTTFAAGVAGWKGIILGLDDATLDWKGGWLTGLEYMVGTMGILLAHEMGHFLVAHRHRVPASFPYFIPLPILLTGTMGAVIRMEAGRANRKQIFDIGIAGPLAGLALAIPVLCIGIKYAAVASPHDQFKFGNPLLVKLLMPLLRPDLPADATLHPNPWYMAAWVGMLITGLNMMPVSQLDGGHVIYGLLGREAKLVSRLFLLAAIGYMVIMEDYFWSTMLILVTLIGVDHPPMKDEHVPLGPFRTVLGVLSLALPVLCFMPTAISVKP